MNGPWSEGQVVFGLAAAALLFGLELVFSVAIIAASSLSRVALHRLAGDDNGRLGFLSAMRDFPSTYRMATAMARFRARTGEGAERISSS